MASNMQRIHACEAESYLEGGSANSLPPQECRGWQKSVQCGEIDVDKKGNLQSLAKTVPGKP